ncbi:MAG TPA: PQQ-binding-like beta-propeller repeat protein [Vicinamibacteria bacterium]|nr:PQQ-binding-like beta-propeller repeat protein [Vicinamibacteria bacterium]
MRLGGHGMTGAGVVAIALGMAAAAAAAPKPSYNWPQWRGPEGQGISRETGLPSAWTGTENVAWKTAIPGRGHSSPVVWGNRVFLTTAVEGEVTAPGAKGVAHTIDGQPFVHPAGVGADRTHTLKVLALDADTGRLLWERTAWEGLPYDTRHQKGSFASPTPVTDGHAVYAFFGSEGLYAYDFDGTLLWKVDLGGIATMGVGVGTSPVPYRDLLILQCDEDNGEKSFLTALDRKTGKAVWRVPRKIQVSWATPIVVRAAGRDELVTSGTEAVIAYDPATGRELWRSRGLESNAVPSPVAGEDVVVLSAGYPAKVAMAVKPGGSGDVTGSPRVLWTYNKGTAYVPSPILYDGHVYLMTDKGLVTCLDAHTGEVKYEGARTPTPGSFMASPVAYEGMILLFSEDGDTHVLKAGPRHEVLRTNPLGEPIFASPAISRGRIFIRGAQHLYCIRNRPS